ncbi:MAG TPA: hypothetical protein VK993_08910 [Chthoniobacterales bacterium]|nr:hypothetical protein [Chthoniobacterales bacterium]
MSDDFRILLEFFEGHALEVGGRAAAELPSELRDKLARFAAGSCTAEEREEVKNLLQHQPELIPVVVTETVALRGPSE